MSEDIKEAVASAARESGYDPTAEAPSEKAEAAPEEAPAEEVPAEGTEPAAEAEEAADDFRLSQEDLDAIDKDPKLKKAYKSMLRDYRDKTAKVAQTRKDFAEQGKLLEAIKEDPDMAVRALAAIRGLKLADPEPTKAVKSEMDVAREKLEAAVGKEGAALLLPLIEAATSNLVEQRVAPLERAAVEFQRTALAQTMNSAVAAFKSEVQDRGDEWSEEIEQEMADLIDKFQPTAKTSVPEYLDVLYAKVAREKNLSKSVKSQISRIKESASSREPVRGVRPAADSPKSITNSMKQADAVAMAVQLARAELSGR